MATFFSSFSTVSNILLLHSSPEKAAFQGILTLKVASSQIPRGNSCRTTAYAEQLSWEELSWEKKSHFRTAWLLFKGSWHGVTIFSLSAEGFFWYIILMCPWTQEFTSKCCLKSKHSKQKQMEESTCISVCSDFLQGFEAKQYKCKIHLPFKNKRGLVLYIHSSAMKSF